jgi:hypothetical protein
VACILEEEGGNTFSGANSIKLLMKIARHRDNVVVDPNAKVICLAVSSDIMSTLGEFEKRFSELTLCLSSPLLKWMVWSCSNMMCSMEAHACVKRFHKSSK